MDRKVGKRIYREATEEEKARHQLIREQIQEELPEIKKRAKQKLAGAIEQGITIQHAVALLKVERERKGLSLSDVKERTGIERSTLSRLENQEEANPTINTLTRYANAVGKKVLIVLADADAREA